MHFKQTLTYMVLGGLLTLAGYILASVSNDSVAQLGAEDVTFGTITCRKLTVIDDEGKKSVVLRTDEHGGIVYANGKDGIAQSGTQDVTFGEIACRKLTVIDDEGKLGVVLANVEHGGIVVAKSRTVV